WVGVVVWTGWAVVLISPPRAAGRRVVILITICHSRRSSSGEASGTQEILWIRGTHGSRRLDTGGPRRPPPSARGTDVASGSGHPRRPSVPVARRGADRRRPAQPR